MTVPPPAPPSQPVPSVAPVPAYGYYYAPPKQDDSKLVILIVLIVVIVIIVPIVVAAFLFFMVSGLVGNPDPAAPFVALAPETSCGSGCWVIEVLDATPSRPLSLFDVTLNLGGTTFRTSVQPGILLNESGFTLQFVDSSPANLLSAGDAFEFDGLVVGGTCSLGIVSLPESVEVASRSWAC